MLKKIAVFGLGLLGGSVCKSLKKIDRNIEIAAYGRDVRKLQKALDEGNVDSVGDINQPVLKGVDLVIVSTPVVISIDIIKDILNRPDLGDDALVIDVGSVKGVIINEVEKNNRADRFIGCHPMAGSEKIGYEYSIHDLFHNASVIITPNRFNSDNEIEKIKSFWQMNGSNVHIQSAEQHDAIVALTSHLPHIVACSVVDVLKDKTGTVYNKGDIECLIGNGFKDVTRISSGSPDVWTDISLLNRGNIHLSVDNLIEKLQLLLDIFNSDEFNIDKIQNYFQYVKEFRDGLSV